MTSLRRCLQRLSIIALSLMAILAITVPGAQAGEGGDSAKIIITKPDQYGSDDLPNWKSMKVTAYQVFKQIGTTTDEKGLYAVTSDFAGFFNLKNTNGSGEEDTSVGTLFKNDGEPVSLGYNTSDNRLVGYSGAETNILGPITVENGPLDTSNGEADLLKRIEASGNDNVATFYTWIEKYIEANKAALDLKSTSVTAGDEESITIDNLESGYYALIFSKVPSGISVKQGILVAAPGEIALKAEPIPVTKTVSKDDGTYREAVSAAMNTILKYKITSKVPTVTDYSNLTEFKLTDTYEHQQLVQTGDKNFQLKVGTKTYTLSSNSFVYGSETIATLDTTTPGTFTVKFDTKVLAGHQTEIIELTYYAQLTADAININQNKVTLDYTNNNDESKAEDSTKVYTYGIEVQKTFSSSGTLSELYKDVNFTLYTSDYEPSADNQGKEIGLIGDSGVYHVPAASDGTAPSTSSTLSLDSEGKLTITGLDAGTYWLEETGAPDEYTAAKPIKITLQANSQKPEELSADESKAYYNGDTSTTDLLTTVTAQNTTSISLGQFTVLNQKGFNLPQTGAAGVWLCVAGGLVLIAVAGVLFVASRGRRNLRSDSRA